MDGGMRMIDMEKVINDLQDAVNDDWMWQHADYYAKAMENAIALLKEQEAVVRCKDCKYCFEKHGTYYCTSVLSDKIAVVTPDWFCADGERKDDP